MRKKYVKPSVVVEVFKMEEAIAAGCGTIIDPDPETCGWFGPYKAVSYTHLAVYTRQTSSLSGITVNGTGVSGFDPDVREYTVSIPTGSTPAVQAQGADNAAVTILPVYENATRILVRAEDGSGITTYTVSYHEAGSVDKAVLAQLIADAESVINNSSDSYTESSVAALTTALAAARTVYNDTGATQQEVSDAETSLRNALAQLEEKSVDKTALAQLIADAESVINSSSDSYTESSVAALTTSLAAARTVYSLSLIHI